MYRISLLPVAVILTLFGCGKPVQPVKEVSATDNLPPAQPIQIQSTDWPWWRGPERNNTATCDSAPTKWSESNNIAWKSKVPGRGHSTPTVVGSRIFLSTADESRLEQSVVCLDRETGELLWEEVVHSGEFPGQGEMHGKSTHANATLACDGQNIFAAFLNGESVYLTSLTCDGERRWQTEVGYFVAKFGYAPSPCLFESTVIVSGDNRGGGFLAAIHRESGDIVWKKARDNQDTYSSAIVAEAGGKSQLLISGNRTLTSYAPSTGEQLWQCEGTAQATCGTVVWSGDLVYASGGYPERQTVCVDATNGSLVWEDKTKCYEQSMLIAQDHLYAVNDDGIASCRDAQTGKLKWKHRLSGPISASPVLVGNLIYATNENGTTWVIEASPESYREVGRNQLGSEAFASLAICDGNIFARVATGSRNERQEYLYCIGD